MIIAEIKKAGQVFQLGFSFTEDLVEAHKAAVTIATGSNVYEGENQIVDLGPSGEYEYIRVFKEEGVAVEPPKPTNLEGRKEDKYIKPFEDTITYLGQVVHTKGIKAAVDGVGFVLIYEVGGLPAQTLMSKQSLKKLTFMQGQVLGWNEPLVLVPAADLLDEEAALEYMEDYLKELEQEARVLKDQQNKTATAYVDFNKDE